MDKRTGQHNIYVEYDGRFVDDTRVFMYTVRQDWRWEEGGLWYKGAWESYKSSVWEYARFDEVYIFYRFCRQLVANPRL